MKKTIYLTAITIFAATGAFAASGTPGGRTNIALNKMEIWKQQEQNDELQDNINYQQQDLNNIMKDKESIQSDVQLLQTKAERATLNGHNARAARIARRISWDQALLQADEDNVRADLAVERSDVHVMNHNVDHMAQEQDAIKRDRD